MPQRAQVSDQPSQRNGRVEPAERRPLGVVVEHPGQPPTRVAPVAAAERIASGLRNVQRAERGSVEHESVTGPCPEHHRMIGGDSIERRPVRGGVADDAQPNDGVQPRSPWRSACDGAH
jgi:hypothetical protein